MKVFSRVQSFQPLKITYEDADPIWAQYGSSSPPGGGPPNPLPQPNPQFDGNGVWFGQSVAGGLDIDEDGYGEIIVGGPYWDYLDPQDPQFNAADTGKSFVIEPVAPVLPLTYRTDVGVQLGELFGWSVAAIGDFDGDGGDDFAVSSRLYMAPIEADVCPVCETGDDDDSGGRGAGSATVLLSDGTQPVRFTGENGRDSLGWAMLGLGDLDGDSEDEFLASAFRWGKGGEDKEEGRFYVLEATQ